MCGGTRPGALHSRAGVRACLNSCRPVRRGEMQGSDEMWPACGQMCHAVSGGSYFAAIALPPWHRTSAREPANMKSSSRIHTFTGSSDYGTNWDPSYQIHQKQRSTPWKVQEDWPSHAVLAEQHRQWPSMQLGTGEGAAGESLLLSRRHHRQLGRQRSIVPPQPPCPAQGPWARVRAA